MINMIQWTSRVKYLFTVFWLAGGEAESHTSNQSDLFVVANWHWSGKWIHGTWNTVELKVNFFFLYFSFAVPTLKIRQDIVTDVGGWLTRLCRLTRTTWSFQAGRNLCWSGRINVQFCPIFLWQQLKATLRNSVSNTATVQRRFRSLKIHSEF